MELLIKFGGFGCGSLYGSGAELSQQGQEDLAALIVDYFNYQFDTKLSYKDLLSNQALLYAEDAAVVHVSDTDLEILKQVITDNKEPRHSYFEKIEQREQSSRNVNEYDKAQALLSALYEWVQYEIHTDLLEELQAYGF